MAKRCYLNNQWQFFESTDAKEHTIVSIPHSVCDMPAHYFDESVYQKETVYIKRFPALLEWKDHSIHLCFDGVAHKASVYLNGELLGVHNCGYTAFSFDVSQKIAFDKNNELKVVVDSRETLNQPPFGFVIDYMTFGGIYRDVYLEIAPVSHIADVFCYTTKEDQTFLLHSNITVEHDCEDYCISQYLDDKRLGSVSTEREVSFAVEDVEAWDIDHPKLYTLHTKLKAADGTLLDERFDQIGFRTSEFRKDGYYLNGRKVLLRGLNRHQSYPYTGYAMPDSLQMEDADILKNELGVNAVRTSHYPQSQAFIRRCDEIGLLVFTEMPGWQHIGDEDWKNQAVENTKDMILQYRNHPSIILWGVRINESADDDAFYERTNEMAHKLDPTRPTGGVRALKKSHLLEDVYTYNDFLHDGKMPGCDPKKKVTSVMEKPYLISEYNGHMYPTKAFDCEEHRREHARRHANVLDAVKGAGNIAGSFGWCMFDYNTHKDFGSGDRVCYHGVMDLYRNPKMASYVYAAEGAKDVVLEISSSMDIGEHPACNRGDTYIYSNADSVKMYKNDRLIKEYVPSDSKYKNLSHGPILVDDYVGNTIYELGEYSKLHAKWITECLNYVALHGMSHFPLSVICKAGLLMLFAHMDMTKATELYTKYVGDWGQTATTYRFEAMKDGKVAKTIVKEPSCEVKIVATSLRDTLILGKTYDVGSIRLKATDQNGNLLSFYNAPVSFAVEGPGELIGPKTAAFAGGYLGTYVKTTKGAKENDVITVSVKQGDSVVSKVAYKVLEKETKQI